MPARRHSSRASRSCSTLLTGKLAAFLGCSLYASLWNSGANMGGPGLRRAEIGKSCRFECLSCYTLLAGCRRRHSARPNGPLPDEIRAYVEQNEASLNP